MILILISKNKGKIMTCIKLSGKNKLDTEVIKQVEDDAILQNILKKTDQEIKAFMKKFLRDMDTLKTASKDEKTSPSFKDRSIADYTNILMNLELSIEKAKTCSTMYDEHLTNFDRFWYDLGSKANDLKNALYKLETLRRQLNSTPTSSQKSGASSPSTGLDKTNSRAEAAPSAIPPLPLMPK
ncbi:MAG: hypothetical protein K1060chlam5_00323 [Candidatus Anoxychlamydiales bacterium]|nr:hypothetical protein [Candidatus Anoxychlamydiales bacterium]